MPPPPGYKKSGKKDADTVRLLLGAELSGTLVKEDFCLGRVASLPDPEERTCQFGRVLQSYF